MTLTLAIAFDPQRTAFVLPPDLIARVARTCDLLTPEPLAEFTSPSARSVLARTEILLTGWGCPAIDRTVLADAPRLRLVAHAAGTVKGFVAPEVFEAGVQVTHAADANAIPVAEFTLAAILFANKEVFRFQRDYRAARGDLLPPHVLARPIGNFRKRIGIIGASKIGRLVLRLLAPFDFDVLLSDPHLSPAEARALGADLVPLDRLMAESDVVSLHAPALPSTRHLIDRRRLGLMRDGATLINTARGILVDQDALIDELRSGRIEAVIDVTTPEVPDASSPLFTLPNVFLTPHVAGALGTERTRLGLVAVEEIERFARGEPMKYRILSEALERMA